MTEQLVGALTRNSTDDQKERQTIERQREILRHWLSQHPEVVLVDWYEDQGISGTVPLSKRPGGRKLLADLRSKRINTVLATSLDRFGRTLEAIVDGFRLVEESGGTLHVLDSPLGTIDTKSPMGKFAFHLLAIVAELERDLIVERSTAGKKIKTRAGFWQGGTVPFGYDVVAGKLAINEAESLLVKEIFYRLLAGESQYSIAHDLNDRGIPSRRKRKDGSSLSEGAWWPASIGQLFNKPKYAGEYWVGTILQEIPAIIPKEHWEQWQARRQTQSRGISRGGRDAGLLSGVLRCAICGNKMYSTNRGTGGNRPVYRCKATTDRSWIHPKYGDMTRCPCKEVRRDVLDAEVVKQIEAVLADPRAWVTRAQERHSVRSATQLEIEQQQATLLQDLEQQQQAIQRVLDLYTRGSINLDLLDHQMAQLEAERESIEQRLRLVQLKLQEFVLQEADDQEALALVMQMKSRWASMKTAERRMFLRRVIQSAWVKTIDPGDGHRKSAEVEIKFIFDEPGAGVGVSREPNDVSAWTLTTKGSLRPWYASIFVAPSTSPRTPRRRRSAMTPVRQT